MWLRSDGFQLRMTGNPWVDMTRSTICLVGISRKILLAESLRPGAVTLQAGSFRWNTGRNANQSAVHPSGRAFLMDGTSRSL